MGVSLCFLSAQTDSKSLPHDSETIIYLIRHAEPEFPPYKETPPNPRLNAVGLKRADQLIHVLKDAGITKIYSTNYNRTQETAQPLAEHLKIEVESYDPGDLLGFAAHMKNSIGRILVSGHSNTTPALVQLLGGDPGKPINEKSEFDRLYVMILNPNQPVTTLLLRYGD